MMGYMQDQLFVYAICLLVSAALTLIASAVAWSRSVQGAYPLSLLLLAMTIWAGLHGLQWIPIPEDLKLSLPYIIYMAVVSIPPLFLVFALTFTGHKENIFRISLFLLIEPLITFALLWTNNSHKLIFLSVFTSEKYNYSILEYVPGSWYMVNMVYSYGLIAAGIVVLIYGLIHTTPLLRNQYIILLLASLIPWGINMYSEYSMGASHLDLTPVTFGLSGILLTYSVVRNRFMEIIPVARGRLIESMSDGVLVLDSRSRIVDINPAMKDLVGQSKADVLGQPASDVLKAWLDKNIIPMNDEQSQIEIRIPNAPSSYLDLRITPLFDNKQHLSGKLMVFRDITDRKQVEKQLRSANDRLQSQLIEIGVLQTELRSQAIRDPLTNLFNRRYMDDILDRELERAARENYPVCIVMLDIDYFKMVNDTYGHEAGDLILKELAGTLTAHNRRGDFICRYGGEEFIIILPNITLDTAYKRATELRKVLNALSVPYGLFNLTFTTSLGIACFPSNGRDRDSIVRAADKAMYAAKNAGRDHILTYDMLNHTDPPG